MRFCSHQNKDLGLYLVASVMSCIRLVGRDTQDSTSPADKRSMSVQYLKLAKENLAVQHFASIGTTISV